MMNKMDVEFIEHYEAKAAAAGTDIDWRDLIDLLSVYDRDLAIRTLNLKYEDELHEYFRSTFRDLVIDMKYQAVQWDMEHDEVNVTRCKFCRYYKRDSKTCGHSNGMISPDPEDYCSRAERLTWHDFRKED